MKKHLFLLFALCISTTLSHAAIVNGTCGDNLTWSLNTKDSTLIIEGEGEMYDYYWDDLDFPYAPWKEYRSYIKVVSILDGVSSIGGEAFYQCNNLTSVEIPNSITSIGYEAFFECTGLTSIEIPNSVTTMGVSVFRGCTCLISVTIPNSVISIRSSAFHGCCSLKSIEIPNTVTSIGDWAFSGCTALTSIEIPNSVTTIGNHAFYNCDQLTSIMIGNGVTNVGEWAFSGCNRLVSVDIPNNVISIGRAFYECTGLTSVTIGNGVTSIGYQTFYNCSSLTSVTIGNGLTSLVVDAFYGCNITSLTIFATNPPSGGANCGLNASNCYLYIPEKSTDLYKNTIWWEDFKEIRSIGSLKLVKFIDWDGTILSSAEVEEGSAATPPADPTRKGYTFIGWDKDFSNITEDLTVTALYKINRFEIKFVDWDGTILKSDSVDWNTAAVAPANPSRVGYDFIGWDKEFGNVTDDLVVMAQYELGEKKEFEIQFKDQAGDVILSQPTIIKVPAAPEIVGFTFIGWKIVSTMLDNKLIEIEAVYKADEPTSAPEVVTNPSNPAQKLIRNGSVYILTDDSRTYTITGQQVK